jgi:hypothetical protein
MQIVALTDKPSPQSFGMTGFVARDGDRLRVHGIRSQHDAEISQEQLEQYIAAGHWRDVAAANAGIAVSLSGSVVGWLGSEFECRALMLGVPVVEGVPPFPWSVPDGLFWVGHPRVVYGSLKQWNDAAVTRAIWERNRPLADLLAWALPQEDSAQAAIWYTRESDAVRDAHLDLQTRIEPRRERRALLAVYRAEIAKILG